jgi:hypothetical protein
LNHRFIFCTIALTTVLLSCKKDHVQNIPAPEPPQAAQKILLKDIIIPRLPSPYYHFEYGPDSLVTKADFASGYFMYDVFYNSGRIGEMRNNILVNHDTLRYIYDNTDRVFAVHFIDQNKLLKRHVIFDYNGAKVSQITWDHRADNDQYMIDRTLTFTYHADGNLKDMTDQRPATPGVTEVKYTTHFDDYDDKINVDDFTLIHDGIHDHLLLLPQLHLQNNNPRKQWVTGITDEYTVIYHLTYNPDDTPAIKAGELLFTSGSLEGKKFNVSTSYSYY